MTYPTYIQDIVQIKDLIYNLRDPVRTKVPKYSNVTYGMKSIRFLGNKLWNNLPINIKMSFRRKIAK